MKRPIISKASEEALAQSNQKKSSRVMALAAVTGGSLLGLVALSSGCNSQEPPITYSITVPAQDTLRFEAQLSKRYGIGITGSFDIFQYGTIFVRGETPSSNFVFGFSLNAGVFLKDTWVNFRETTSLPTGALFPAWVNTEVVDVSIPAANTPPVDFNFYFGTRGQLHVGLAASIKAIDQNFPDLYIDYAFYDRQGRVILGLVFYGPKKDSSGNLLQPGGIFVGSNITPFLPADVIAGLPKNPSDQPGPLALAEGQRMLVQALSYVESAEKGTPVTVQGKSLVSEIKFHGKDAHRIRSSRDLRKAVNQFLSTTR